MCGTRPTFPGAGAGEHHSPEAPSPRRSALGELACWDILVRSCGLNPSSTWKRMRLPPDSARCRLHGPPRGREVGMRVVSAAGLRIAVWKQPTLRCSGERGSPETRGGPSPGQRLLLDQDGGGGHPVLPSCPISLPSPLPRDVPEALPRLPAAWPPDHLPGPHQGGITCLGA